MDLFLSIHLQKQYLLITLLINLLFKWTLLERSLKSLLRSLVIKSLVANIFVERLGFNSCSIKISHCGTSLYWLCTWSKLKRFLDPVAVSELEEVRIDNYRQKNPPFLIKSKTICGHLIRVHFFIDHGGYSIGASVRKLHFCSMCSKETQMKRIFYYGK